jgi:hypothetical protein
MSAKSKLFIIVAISDPWGFNEKTLPLLLQLVDKSKPDFGDWCHSGVTAFFKKSKTSMKRAADLLSAFQDLRSKDERFNETGIGQTTGPLMADINWRGRILSLPIGSALNEAVKLANKDQSTTARSS